MFSLVLWNESHERSVVKSTAVTYDAKKKKTSAKWGKKKYGVKVIDTNDDKNLLEKIEIDKKGRILQPGQELATPRSQERKELEEKNKQNVQNTAATWDLENKLVTCKSLYADLEKVAEADRLEEKEQEEARALKRAMSRQRPPVTVPHASLTRTKSQTKSAQKPEDRPAAKPKKDRKTEDHIQRNENLPTMTANVAVTSAKKKLTSNLHQMKNHRQLKNGLIDTEDTDSKENEEITDSIGQTNKKSPKQTNTKKKSKVSQQTLDVYSTSEEEETDRVEKKKQKKREALKRSQSNISGHCPPVLTKPLANLTMPKSQRKPTQKPEESPAKKPVKERKAEDKSQRNIKNISTERTSDDESEKSEDSIDETTEQSPGIIKRKKKSKVLQQSSDDSDDSKEGDPPLSPPISTQSSIKSGSETDLHVEESGLSDEETEHRRNTRDHSGRSSGKESDLEDNRSLSSDKVQETLEINLLSDGEQSIDHENEKKLGDNVKEDKIRTAFSDPEFREEFKELLCDFADYFIDSLVQGKTSEGAGLNVIRTGSKPKNAVGAPDLLVLESFTHDQLLYYVKMLKLTRKQLAMKLFREMYKGQLHKLSVSGTGKAENIEHIPASVLENIHRFAMEHAKGPHYSVSEFHNAVSHLCSSERAKLKKSSENTDKSSKEKAGQERRQGNNEHQKPIKGTVPKSAGAMKISSERHVVKTTYPTTGASTSSAGQQVIPSRNHQWSAEKQPKKSSTANKRGHDVSENLSKTKKSRLH